MSDKPKLNPASVQAVWTMTQWGSDIITAWETRGVPKVEQMTKRPPKPERLIVRVGRKA